MLRDRQARPVFVLDPVRLTIVADPSAITSVPEARALARQLADDLVAIALAAHVGFAVATAEIEAGLPGQSYTRVANRFGIDTATLWRWRMALQNRAPTLQTPAAGSTAFEDASGDNGPQTNSAA